LTKNETYFFDCQYCGQKIEWFDIVKPCMNCNDDKSYIKSLIKENMNIIKIYNKECNYGKTKKRKRKNT